MKSESKNSNNLNDQRRLAVQLRLAGGTLAEVSTQVGLSNPTIIAAVKAFKQGGWPAVDVKPRGRPRREDALASSSGDRKAKLVQAMVHGNDKSAWTTARVQQWLKDDDGVSVSRQTVAANLHTWQLLPANKHKQLAASNSAAPQAWLNGSYADFKASAKASNATVLWIGVQTLASNVTQLYAHTLRGRCLWLCVNGQPNKDDYKQLLALLSMEFPKGIALVLPSKHLAVEIAKLTQSKTQQLQSIVAPSASNNNKSNDAMNTSKNSSVNYEKQSRQKMPNSSVNMHEASPASNQSNDAGFSGAAPHITQTQSNHTHLPGVPNEGLTHLQLLEAESIQIMREVIAEAENPVMLYSLGKDSAVMYHLARKAFYPAEPPFPLLHIDTLWKFQEMYQYRDNIAKELGFELLVHVNQEGVDKQVNPFSHGSALHTDIMKTEGLKQALDKHGFDFALAGARRDEENSRSKERVFSFRTSQHRWDPKNQRPELWNLYNTRKHPGESLRVYPLSNWTELDIWQYIHAENIPVVPLYFAAERPVVERDGSLIMVDDDRMPLNAGEVPVMRNVRFRTLGCYPLTSAVVSEATTLPEIIQEMLVTNTSERHGRLIDRDMAASMEKKKQEGYF